MCGKEGRAYVKLSGNWYDCDPLVSSDSIKPRSDAGRPRSEASSQPSGRPKSGSGVWIFEIGQPSGTPSSQLSSKPRSIVGIPTNKQSFCGGPPSPITLNGQPRASKAPKRVRFATGYHSGTRNPGQPSVKPNSKSGPPKESSTPYGVPRSGIHSVTAPIGREHCRVSFTSKFPGDSESLLYWDPKVRYTNSSVPPKATKIPVKGKPIIVNNFASMSGVPIKLEQPTIGKQTIEFPMTHLTKGLAAFNRNQTCLDTCNNADENLISKLHLPNDLSSIFNPSVHTLDDENFVPANWFLKATEAVVKTNTPAPKTAPFKFSTEAASVAHNTQLLRDTGNDFASIIDNNQDTSLSYSSEFRSLKALSSIYNHHDTFPFFSSVHQQGIHYTFTQMLSDEEITAEFNLSLQSRPPWVKPSRPKESKSENPIRVGFRSTSPSIDMPLCAYSSRVSHSMISSISSLDNLKGCSIFFSFIKPRRSQNRNRKWRDKGMTYAACTSFPI